jgi:hypothetical protein
MGLFTDHELTERVRQLESKVWHLEMEAQEQRAELQARLDAQADELRARLGSLEKQRDLLAALVYVLAGETGLTAAQGRAGNQARALLADLRKSGVHLPGPRCRCEGCFCPWPASGRDHLCYACRHLHQGRRQAWAAFAKRGRHRRPPAARLVESRMVIASDSAPESPG